MRFRRQNRTRTPDVLLRCRVSLGRFFRSSIRHLWRLAVQASPFVVESRESPFDAEISNNFESTKLMMLADFVDFGSC
jgi:hypothetical protein